MLIPDQTLILDQLVPCCVGFDSSTTSGMGVHALGWARGQNLGHLRFFFFYGLICI